MKFTSDQKKEAAEALVAQWQGLFKWYDGECESTKWAAVQMARIFLGDDAPEEIHDGIAAPIAFWFQETYPYYWRELERKLSAETGRT